MVEYKTYLCSNARKKELTVEQRADLYCFSELNMATIFFLSLEHRGTNSGYRRLQIHKLTLEIHKLKDLK